MAAVTARQLCQFPTLDRGARCRHCGWRLPRDFARAPRRNCPKRVVAGCQHFTCQMTRTVTRTGKGCPRARGIYACSLLGECVPLLPAVPGLPCCEGCTARDTG